MESRGTTSQQSWPKWVLLKKNCFLFCRIEDMEVENLKAILDTYGKAFGQLINLNKSEFSSFSQTKAIILTGSHKTTRERKVFGSSLTHWKKQKIAFNFIKDKIWKHIKHQSSKHLSKTGKEILIIPSYSIILYEHFSLAINFGKLYSKNDEQLLVGF